MRITVALHHRFSGIIVLGGIVAFCGVFVFCAVNQFIVAVLSDPRLEINSDTLAGAVQRYPRSARLQARWASHLLEAGVNEKIAPEMLGREATDHALQAVHLAPWNYEARVLLAAARELDGDLEQAETDLRSALVLAPMHIPLHWRLANLLLREGKLEEAIREFRLVSTTHSVLLVPALGILWQVSDGVLDMIRLIAGPDPESQLILAHFLIKQQRSAAAMEIICRLPAADVLRSTVTKQVLDLLVEAKQFADAHQVWNCLRGSEDRTPGIWNGSFELERNQAFSHFDWQFSESRYAQFHVTRQQAHGGRASLAIIFQGIETTRLENEIRHLILVTPGQRYQLEGYAKALALTTEEGPYLVVTKTDDHLPLAKTAAVGAGTHEWELLQTEFVAPPQASALWVMIRQTPQYSYAPPTTGLVWFDDLIIKKKSDL